jgi:hypothetical protein
VGNLRARVTSLTDARGAESTKHADQGAWRRWEQFCGLMNTPPQRPSSQHMSAADLTAETTLLQQFVVWVYDGMQPKRHDDALPRPSSAMAVALAIRRCHARQHITTPAARQIGLVLYGLELAYVEELGTAALLPQRKGPLTATMLHSMLSLRSFAVNGRAFTWASQVGISIRAMFLIMWRTGMRKDDAIRLRCSSVWARADGGFDLRPGSSKTDPLGQKWGLDVISLPAPGADPLDASSGLRALAPAVPTAPLFRGADWTALAHSFVDAVFHASAVAALGAEPAKDLSTHSFRIGVATRLAEAGFSNDYIRRFCRWATVSMVDVYARQLQGSFADGHAALCCPLPVSGSTPAPDPGLDLRAGRAPTAPPRSSPATAPAPASIPVARAPAARRPPPAGRWAAVLRSANPPEDL